MKTESGKNRSLSRIALVAAIAALLPLSCMYVEKGGEPVSEYAAKPPVENDEGLFKNPSSGKNAGQLYGEALSAYRSGNFEKSSSLFSEFAAQFPSHDLADNAVYWKGECFYARNDSQKALKTFEMIPEKYPKGNKVPDSLLKAGLCCIKTGDRKNALFYLKKVVAEYPSHPASAKAGVALSSLETR